MADGASALSTEERLASLEQKLDACLILAKMLLSSENFKIDLSDQLNRPSPLELRAFTHAQSLASSVSIAVATPLPECADERLLQAIHRMVSGSNNRADQEPPQDSRVLTQDAIPS